jgi:hypothetical protein
MASDSAAFMLQDEAFAAKKPASLPCCHTLCRRTDFSAQNLMCVSSLIRVKKRTMIDGR